MKKSKKPSPEYISKLINVIQECKAETGVRFMAFLFPYIFRQPEDHELVRLLKEMYEEK